MSSFAMTHALAAPMIEAAWRDQQCPRLPAVAWQWALTPALPQSWPPRTGSRADAFAYAYGADQRLHDAMLVGAPWARLSAELIPEGEIVLAPIGDAVVVIGTQGFEPLTDDEVTVYEAASAVERVLAGAIERGSIPPDDTIEAITLRTFYGQWLRHNGIVAAELRAAAGDFLDWCRA